jgi:hypothetical protein
MFRVLHSFLTISEITISFRDFSSLAIRTASYVVFAIDVTWIAGGNAHAFKKSKRKR